MYTLCKQRASSGGTSAFKRKCYFLCVLKNEYASGRKRGVAMYVRGVGMGRRNSR